MEMQAALDVLLQSIQTTFAERNPDAGLLTWYVAGIT